MQYFFIRAPAIYNFLASEQITDDFQYKVTNQNSKTIIGVTVIITVIITVYNDYGVIVVLQ